MSIENPGPVTLDKVDGFTYYGVKVVDIGEDCESIYAFTHDRRRAIAAARRHIRSFHGETATEIAAGDPTYAQVFTHCGCTDHDTHEDCVDCEHFGLPPCRDEYAWFVEQGHTVWAENAIPVIDLDWNC